MLQLTYRTFVLKGGNINKKKIIDCSISLVNELGIENFSMRKLADKLELSPSTLYYHFKDKGDILDECIKLAIDVKEIDYPFESLEEFLIKYYHLSLSRRKYVKFIMNYIHTTSMTDLIKERVTELTKIKNDNFKRLLDSG